MKFRKRVKIFPGFNLNFSASGVSATLGIKGASLNFGNNGMYLNTGIPGSGFYDRQKLNLNNNNNSDSTKDTTPLYETIQYLSGEIKSAEIEKLTSISLIEIKKSLEEVYNERYEIEKEILLTKRQIQFTKIGYIISCILIVGLIVKSIKNNLTNKKEYLLDLEEQLKNAHIDIDIYFDENHHEKYDNLLESYKLLFSSQIIWDITTSVYQDTKTTRSAASSSVTRKAVLFKLDNIDIIRSRHSAFHFENKNGGDLYIYPAFVITTNNNREFALISLEDFELIFSEQKFLEEDKIPSDTKTIDKTWAKVNKNGLPDKRFKDNYEIPIVRYGQFLLKSNSGLNENYVFSSYENSEAFAKSFEEYKNILKKLKSDFK